MLKNKRYLDVKGIVPIRLNPRGGGGGGGGGGVRWGDLVGGGGAGGGGGRGGYSWEFLVGVCRWVQQILTLFQTRKCHIHTRFPTWPLMHNIIITLD